MRSQTWIIDLPEQWRHSPIVDKHPLATCKLDDGDVLLAHLTLADGTSIMAVSWTGGQRLACIGAATEWFLQEHYDGDLPDGRPGETIEKMWSVAVESLLQAKDETIAEMPDEAEELGLR